jgi:hypothetical protein
VVGGERLEQLDRIARRVLEQDLPDAHAGDELVAEAGALGTQLVDGGGKARDLQGDPVPASGFRQRAVGHRGAAARAAPWHAEQQPQVAPVEHGEHRRRAQLHLEPQQVPVKHHRGLQVGHEVADGDGAHRAFLLAICERSRDAFQLAVSCVLSW